MKPKHCSGPNQIKPGNPAAFFVFDKRIMDPSFVMKVAADPVLGPLIKAPCLTCPVEHLCGDNPTPTDHDHTYSPQTCPMLGEWVEWSKGSDDQLQMLKFKQTPTKATLWAESKPAAPATIITTITAPALPKAQKPRKSQSSSRRRRQQ